MGGVAKGVSRQLVQQDDQGQGGVRRLKPMIQPARGGGEVGIAAPLGEGAVEGGVLGEPFSGPASVQKAMTSAGVRSWVMRPA